MQQRNETNYPEVISMEEYLTKRQKIREKERKNTRRTAAEDDGSAWLFTEVYM